MIGFVTLEDISQVTGGGVATRELLVAMGRAAPGRLVVCCPKPAGDIPTRLREEVDRFRFLPASDGSGQLLWHLRAELRVFAHLREMITEGPPELVVTRLTPSTLFPALLCQRHGVPHALLVRGWVTRDRAMGEWPVRLLSDRLLRMNVRRSTDVFVAFEALRERFGRFRAADQTPVTVLPNAVDPALFDSSAAEPAIDRPDAALVVGFVGTFSQRHRLPALVRGAGQVDGVHLLFIGDGPTRADLETLVDAQGLDDRVTFTGRVLHEDVPAYIAACDAGYGVVDPDSPSNPIKCYEYLACGRPVVTSETAEFRFVDDIDAGVTLRTVTPDAVASALAELRDRGRDERRSMGERGRRYVREHHTWERVAETILETSGAHS